MIKSGQVVLSKRLQMLANLVTPGNRVADIGCDHGFLSIYLVQKGISPQVIAMDVRKGPLAAAKEHIGECNLEEYIDTRLSDGLKELTTGEADTVICAGMGGPLMEKILTDSMEKAVVMKELILQPQSEIREFRVFLRKSGFQIVEEDACFEEGKYYFAMKVIYRGNRENVLLRMEDTLAEEFGAILLEKRHPVLEQFLQFKKAGLERLEQALHTEETERSRTRLLEIISEKEQVNKALEQFYKS